MHQVLAFVVGTIGLLAFISLLLWAMARGNWARLARGFRTDSLPNGTRFRSVSGRVGTQLIVGGLTVLIAEEGLGLWASLLGLRTPFHPPLLIPWPSISPDRSGTLRHEFPLRVDTACGPISLELDGPAGRAVRKLIEARQRA